VVELLSPTFPLVSLGGIPHKLEVMPQLCSWGLGLCFLWPASMSSQLALCQSRTHFWRYSGH